MEQYPLLAMRNISKSFPGVKALDNLNFDLRSGEVHGILGENGAGKSTLIKVLGGIYHPEQGEILINGQKVTIQSVMAAKAQGISIIHQELMLVPHMTVAENIYLTREPKTHSGRIDKAKMNADAQSILDGLGTQIRADTLVGRLSIAQQQQVEIAKALSMNAKILVMDEPTSSLTESEVGVLFQIMRRLRQQGVGIIYISHRMAELFEITDRITVIRDGRFIGTRVTSETDADSLIAMMVGAKLESYYTFTKRTFGEVALEVRNIRRQGVLNDVSFSVREGEVLGFGGIVGAGRSELMRSILGLDPMDGGEIYIGGKRLEKPSPRAAQRMGLVLVPENRKLEGLVLNNSVEFNATLAVLDEFISPKGLSKHKRKAIVDHYVDVLSIKTSSNDKLVCQLSGGNQQKVVIAKWLAAKPKVLILDEPTRGIDVGAKADIYKIIDSLAQQGIAIIIISSELNEVINICDHVAVMFAGRINKILDKSEATQETILKYATGSVDENA
ncbi:MAG TPA: sugar ABC transporter ATP-binding protein [Candidatus Limiplasma pullistercoris]|nr:sugar ABC transporter ATP-binding protein [Candidatus Limiplasma pullistercoris]